MIVYYSIFAYTCIVSLFGCFLKREKYKNKDPYLMDDFKTEKSISLFFALVSVALLVFFAGKRTIYGDTHMYIREFEELSVNVPLSSIIHSDSEEKGFEILLLLFKKYISSDFSNWFMAISIFQAGAIVLLYYKYSCSYFMSMFLFVSSTTFIWMFNGVRQFTSVCLIMYFFDYVVNKKTIGFLIIVILAFTIHQSAIFWIPMYFIVHFKPFSRKIWVCVGITLIVVFFVDQFTDLLDSSLEGTSYAGAGSELMNYDNDGAIEDNGINPIRVLVAAVAPAIALFRKKDVDEISNPTIDCCINLSTASVGIYLVGMVTSGILVGRIPVYFNLTDYILLPWLLNNLFNGKSKTIIKTACYLFYIVYFIYIMKIQGAGYYFSSILNLAYFA